MPNPRCTAKSKRTHEQCKKPAMNGGTVCEWHGGRIPVVRRKAAERIAQAELLKAAKDDPTLVDASPAELLLHAAHSTGRVVMMLQNRGAGSTPDPATLDLLGQWLDRLSKASSLVVSSKASELVIEQQTRIAEGQARQLAEVMNRTLNALGLTPEQAARVPAALQGALQSLGLISDPVTPTQPAEDSSGRLPTLELTIDEEDLL